MHALSAVMGVLSGGRVLASCGKSAIWWRTGIRVCVLSMAVDRKSLVDWFGSTYTGNPQFR